MKIRIVAIILLIAIMVVGCGAIDEESITKTTEKKEEIAVVYDVENEEDVAGSGAKIVTEETAEETPTESAPVESIQEADKQIETKKSIKKTEVKKETPTPTVTTPVVSEPIATPEPEAAVEECEHWYQPVEEIEYDMIDHYVFGSNCCGYPLFTIENHDAINIPDLYVHPDYHDAESDIDCTEKFTAWHSEYYYQGYCYACHCEIQLRTCTVFHVRAETCVQNEGVLGAYEKVEPGHAYIKACDCGENILMRSMNGKGLMIKKMKCSYCGDIKTYPEQ